MAQGQDTGRAPEGTAEAAPIDDMGDVFDQLTAAGAVTLAEGPKGSAEGGEAATGATGGNGPAAAAAPAAGLPDPSTVNADGSVKGATGPAAGAEGASAAEGATGAPAGATGATGAPAAPAPTPDLNFGKEFLDQLKQIVAPPKPEEPAAPAITPWNDTEQALVAKAREEFPEVFNAFDLEAKRLAQTVVAHVFKQLGPRIGALELTTTEASAQTHDQQVMAAVPDMATIAPKVMDWIGTLPPALKQAYGAVAETGSVADVIGMVDHWRTATNTAKPAPTPAPANANGGGAAVPAQPDAAAAAEAAAAAKRAKIAASNAPVGGKLSGTAVDVIDRNNFDDAFDKFSSHAAVA